MLIMHKKPQQVERIAVEKSSDKKVINGGGSVGNGNPITYLTSIQSLKKKSQPEGPSQVSQKSSENKPAPSSEPL